MARGEDAGGVAAASEKTGDAGVVRGGVPAFGRGEGAWEGGGGAAPGGGGGGSPSGGSALGRGAGGVVPGGGGGGGGRRSAAGVPDLSWASALGMALVSARMTAAGAVMA
jgi:hypothetical protein